MAHAFFASYARLDNDKKRLRNVILDLRERVRSKLGAQQAEQVGFFDQIDGILTGQDWQNTLGEAARYARVLVCFCSNTYFNSEYCANEFEVFRRRLQAPGVPGTLRVIIPVIWDSCVVPGAVSKYQDADESSGFPADYRQQGLLALKRNKTQKYQSRYDATMDAITKVIEQAALGKALPPLPQPVLFDELPGVFDNPGAYNVAVGALHPNGLRWELGPGLTVRRIVENVASKEKLPWRAIKVGDAITKVLDDAAVAREVVVFVADEKSIASGAWKVRFDAVVPQLRANSVLLVGLDAAGVGVITSQDALGRIAALAPVVPAEATVDWFPTDAPETMQIRLSEHVVKLKMALMKGDAAERVVDDALTAAARRDGIAVDVRPSVTGPSGARP